MSILTDDDLRELQEEWNPKHYGDPKHERYIADTGVRGMVSIHAFTIWTMTLAEFKKRMEETEL